MASALQRCTKWYEAIRLCRLVCGSAVRFRSAAENVGLRPEARGHSPQIRCTANGRPEAFRTPDGTADSPKDFLCKVVLCKSNTEKVSKSRC
jgi:hypothetical protein